MFTIITDSGADMRLDFMRAQKDFIFLPMTYTMGGESFFDEPGKGLDSEAFYQRMRAGEVSVTAQITANTLEECVRPLLKEGKAVVYLTLSSGLSGTYNSAMVARNTLLEEMPGAQFEVVDSLAASAGQTMIVHKMLDMREQGKTMQETVTWLEENRLSMVHWVTVDDLNYLKRGGRCTPAAAFFGTMLSIKPLIYMDDEGKLIASEKVRGRMQALRAIADLIAKVYDRSVRQNVFISNAACPEDAQEIAKMIGERLEKPMNEFVFSDIGPVIGSHSGPGTLAVFCWGTDRK